jgi:hypothetical protein
MWRPLPQVTSRGYRMKARWVEPISEQLSLFARYAATRANHQPPECDLGDKCWVRYGPPAINGLSICRGCGGNCYKLRRYEHDD